MTVLSRILLVAAALAIGHPAHAESLRCSGGIVDEGDSRISVLRKCGQPQFADTFCAPVYFGGTLRPVPDPYIGTIVPCQQIDEWLYERGEGNMVAAVRLRAGAVLSIRHRRDPP